MLLNYIGFYIELSTVLLPSCVRTIVGPICYIIMYWCVFGVLIVIFNAILFCLYFFQGLKRLKKHQPNGKCGQATSFSCSTTDDSDHNSCSSTIRSKEAHNSTSRSRSSDGTPIPISIRYKKLSHDEAVSKHIGNQKDDRFLPEMIKRARNPPPLEMGPKRLKIKGPSFMGLDERLR